jgi:hypothetical protein
MTGSEREAVVAERGWNLRLHPMISLRSASSLICVVATSSLTVLVVRSCLVALPRVRASEFLWMVTVSNSEFRESPVVSGSSSAT